MSTQNPDRPMLTRRQALSCLATWSGAAVVWTVAGGVPRALGATRGDTPMAASGNALTFVQISDTHIGFRKDANPDDVGIRILAKADVRVADLHERQCTCLRCSHRRVAPRRAERARHATRDGPDNGSAAPAGEAFQRLPARERRRIGVLRAHLDSLS